MLALLQDVMEAPGGSATELLPSSNSPEDEAQVVQEQASEEAPVLQVDILPKAQVLQGPTVTRTLLHLLVPLPPQLQLPVPLLLPVLVPMPLPIAFASAACMCLLPSASCL